MAKVGIGIVGTGHRGPQLAARVAEMEDAELIAVCDVVPALAEAVAAEYGAKAFATVEEMVEEPGLDAVEVVTPSVHHAHPTIVAAKAGKHVAVATPFAVTLDECDRMIAAAEESGVNLMFAQTHRYSANEHSAKRLIDDGEIGDVIWATWTRMRGANPRWRLSGPTGPPDRWSRWRKSGGGFFVYEGTHLTDMFRWFTGSDVATVFSVGMGVYSSIGDGEDNAIGALRFKSGAFGTINEGTSDPGGLDRDWRIVGTKGMIEIGDEVRLGKDGWTTVDSPPVGDHQREFVDSILEGRTPSCDGHDGRAALEASLAIIRSEETGEAVHLPLE